MENFIRTDKQKIIRTLRIKNNNVIGTLAKLISTLTEAGADIGNIKTEYVGELYVVRDITITVNDDAHLKDVVDRVSHLPNVNLKQVIDAVLELHSGGKIKTAATYPVNSIEDLRKVYTPGVAQVCSMIKRNPSEANYFTSIQKNVALVTNGSRVLGLGNIGPLGSMPVMEGKCALFSQLTGLNMFPILLTTRDPQKFIETVVEIASGFGAIQMEDIETPACFEIEEGLISRLEKPVMHDDQHGTAVVALAAAINACKLAAKDIKKLKIGQLGLGAAGQAIAFLIKFYTGNTVAGFDINQDACDRYTRLGGNVSTMEDIMKDCDLVVMTTGRRGLVKPEMIKKDQIILALSNPYPEITIEEARKAGAAFALDGTRVNNLLGYPGIFKGALEVHATKINKEMLIAAAEEIAACAPGREPIPEVLDPKVHERVGNAVSQAAIKTGIARYIPEQDRFYKK